VLVRRRKDRVDAQLAATLLEQAVDVNRLGVGLDGDVVRTVFVLLDVNEELVENICCLWLLLQEVDVSVARRSAHEDHQIPVFSRRMMLILSKQDRKLTSNEK
jgi:hypothetical protein